MCVAKKEMASLVHVLTASQAATQSLFWVRPLLSVRRTRPGQLVLKLSIARAALRASTCKVAIGGPRDTPSPAAVVISRVGAISTTGGADAVVLDDVAGPAGGVTPLAQAESVRADRPRMKRARSIARVNQTESVSSSFQLRPPDFTSRMNVQISCVSTASVIDPPMTFPSASLTIAAMSASNRTDIRAIG